MFEALRRRSILLHRRVSGVSSINSCPSLIRIRPLVCVFAVVGPPAVNTARTKVDAFGVILVLSPTASRVSALCLSQPRSHLVSTPVLLPYPGRVLMDLHYLLAGTELVGLAASETPNPRETMPSAVKGTFWRIVSLELLS